MIPNISPTSHIKVKRAPAALPVDPGSIPITHIAAQRIWCPILTSIGTAHTQLTDMQKPHTHKIENLVIWFKFQTIKQSTHQIPSLFLFPVKLDSLWLSFLNFIIILCKFHTMYFHHIHTSSNSSQIHSPISYLPNSVLFNLCCPYNSWVWGHPLDHVQSTRSQALMNTDPPFPRSYPLQLGVGLHAHLPASYWNLSDLGLHSTYACHHIHCEFMFSYPVCLNSTIFLYLSIASGSCDRSRPLLCTDSWALEEGKILMSYLRFSDP